MTDLFDLREASIYADRYKVYSDERGKMAGIIYAAIAANKALRRELDQTGVKLVQANGIIKDYRERLDDKERELREARMSTLATEQSRDRAYATIATARAKLSGMTYWLEQNQPDVFRRGIWDAIDAALAQDKP